MEPYSKPGGIILLGGKSKRMGTDKYLLPFFNLTLAEILIFELEKVTAEVILITNEPEKLSFLPHAKFKDLYSIPSALTGLHSGLKHSQYKTNFVLACDLPLFNARMVPYFTARMLNEIHAVVPETAKGLEPLCALYSKKCLPIIEQMFLDANYSIQNLFKQIRTLAVPQTAVEAETHSGVFYNMNTPEEYQEALTRFSDINKKS